MFPVFLIDLFFDMYTNFNNLNAAAAHLCGNMEKLGKCNYEVNMHFNVKPIVWKWFMELCKKFELRF